MDTQNRGTARLLVPSVRSYVLTAIILALAAPGFLLLWNSRPLGSLSYFIPGAVVGAATATGLRYRARSKDRRRLLGRQPLAFGLALLAVGLTGVAYLVSLLFTMARVNATSASVGGVVAAAGLSLGLAFVAWSRQI